MYNRREKIRSIVKKLESGSFLGDAVAASGMDRSRFYWWRKRPAQFSKFWNVRLERLINALTKNADSKNVEDVENAFLGKLNRGEGSCADYAFFLCNRAPERWKHVQQVANINNVNVQAEMKNEILNQNIAHAEEIKYLDSLGEKDLDDLCSRIVEKRQTQSSKN